MEYSEVIRRRRMVRDYTDQPLPAEVIEKVLASALRAPSAGFSQGYAFLALTEAGDRDRFWRHVPFMGSFASMRKAPLIVVALSNKSVYLDRYAEQDKGWSDRSEARWPVPYWDIDTGMAALLMLLTAVDEELGACFIGIEPADIPAFRAEFAVPEEFSPIGAVTVGYRAAGTPAQSSAVTRRRRDPAEVIHRGHWGRGG
ncbi:MAG TPA: nitroreductase family protein [Trebonia sp.]|nr:nitroreductase family protein [Trebonia sp.]